MRAAGASRLGAHHVAGGARRRWILQLVGLLGAVACGPDRSFAPPIVGSELDAIVVESATLEETRSASGAGCEVSGRIRNEGERDQAVTLRFTAFDGSEVIGRATSEERRVPAGGRARYTARLVRIPHLFGQAFGDCHLVDRLEVRIQTRPL